MAGAPSEQKTYRWLLPVAIVSAVALLGVVLWAVFTEDAPEGRVADLAATAPLATDTTTTQMNTPTPVQTVADQGGVQSSSSVSSNADIGGDSDVMPVEMQRSVADMESRRDWLMSPEAGAASLLALYGVDAAGGRSTPCQGDLPSDLRCELTEARSWNTLEEEGRPALLSLLDDARRESRALFLGTNGNDAILANADGMQRVALRDLATLWTGEVWFLWRSSPAINRTLQRGDSGQDVREVAEMFAAIDGQAQPLTESLFTPALETRVKIFQQAMGLNADGVLGERTLRSLVLAAGRDLSLEAAQEQITSAARGSSGV